MPLYDCGDPDCTECRSAFGPDRTKAIENYRKREVAYAEMERKAREGTVTQLADTMNTFKTRIDQICMMPAVRNRAEDDSDPEFLRQLADFCVELASATNEPLRIVAQLGRITQPALYAKMVSDAIEGNLDFELRDRADRIEEYETLPNINDEHRLSARELGVAAE